MAEWLIIPGLSKAAACLSVRVKYGKQVPEKIADASRGLQTLHDVLEEMMAQRFSDAVFKGWISEVRSLAFQVEDVMDRYLYHAREVQLEGPLMKIVKGTHYARIFSEIYDDIDQIERRINKVVELKQRWLGPSEWISANLKNGSAERQKAKYIIPGNAADDGLVGIEENRKMLSDWLHSKDLETTVIAISGMGGVGKTTLVKNVYERETRNFQVHAWIHVSQSYTVGGMLKKLLGSIGHQKQAQFQDHDEMDVDGLMRNIRAMLSNIKCLIVLDDIWDEQLYGTVLDALPNHCGSRIIITTRMNHFARLGRSSHHLQLQTLHQADAFALFCRKAFSHNDNMCPEELEGISACIVDKCQGLPLAIVSIGRMLSSVPPTHYVWSKTYNQLQDQLTYKDHVMAALYVSYCNLPGYLRNCFLYCSMFPQNYPMPRDSLVRQWVAEGFVVPKEREAPEEVAHGYLMDLIHCSMLESVGYDELGRVATCRMHDLLRDLAVSVSKELMFCSANHVGELIEMDATVRRLSLARWSHETGQGFKFPNIRTLVAIDIRVSSSGILSSILSKSSWLTVLELQDSKITEVPESIGYFLNLRYIGLRRSDVRSLPESIEKLSNLQTLDIKATRIHKLPQAISLLTKLRHLLADRFADEEQLNFRFFVGVEAPKGLPNLQELQTLETVQSSNNLAEQLAKLMQLRSVWIDNLRSAHCAELFSTLSKMPHLSSLLLSAVDENEPLLFETLVPTSTNLHRLIIRGQWADGTLECPIFQNYGGNLKYLALEWCQLGEDSLGVLATLVPNLTYLRLDMVRSESDTLVLREGCFPELKMLILKRMPDIKTLDIMVGALPSIEAFYIQALKNLEMIHQGISSLKSLKTLWLLELGTDFQHMKQEMEHVADLRVLR